MIGAGLLHLHRVAVRIVLRFPISLIREAHFLEFRPCPRCGQIDAGFLEKIRAIADCHRVDIVRNPENFALLRPRGKPALHNPVDPHVGPRPFGIQNPRSIAKGMDFSIELGVPTLFATGVEARDLPRAPRLEQVV